MEGRHCRHLPVTYICTMKIDERLSLCPVNEKSIGLIVSLIPVAVYFFLLLRYCYNFPFYDDYIAVLEAVSRWQYASSFNEKLSLLVEQHNEHRIVYIHVISLLDNFLRGSVHFTDLVWCGNISLLLVLFLLYKSAESISEVSMFWLLPVVLLLFQLQSWDNTYWAMASLANFGIHGWVISAIYLASRRERWAWAGAISATLLALGTIGSGLFLIPVVLAVWGVQKRFRELLLGGLVLIIAVLLYFKGYQQPEGYPSLAHTLKHADWAQLLLFWGAFLGSNTYHPALSFVAPLMGWCGIGWFLWLTFRLYFQKNPVLYGVLGFLVLTALAVALNRYGRGIEGAYPSRYRMNSSLFLAVTYLTVVELTAVKWKSRVVMAGSAATLALYVMSVYVYLPRIKNNYELRVADHWLFRHQMPIAGSYRLKDANEMLQTSVKEGLFIPPPLPENLFKDSVERKQLSVGLPVAGDTSLKNNAAEYDIDEVKIVDKQVVIRGWVRFKKAGLTLNEVYIFVNTEKGYPTLFQKRYDLFEKYHDARYQDTGFLGAVPLSEWPKSPKGWHLLVEANNGQRSWLSPK
ncbi:hypothetical protein [Runella slithyformis]|uniref:Glycosyltransferase RgtA/B/C/D-like domain-containing protein n=1 Tax=Runella slithyformis (strain ATCC 29530 / DSM 19594 / LMG 11500 / NCIMB 11436 / LSU 4) TaxID=761193 RepID=A0A7U3ZG75_RUNSL|nr:hypothetical protein [Runella slithyformis]AEI46552.1 hypothetical protein Runsl_0093 [Runella slithyformis DSM 19594]